MARPALAALLLAMLVAVTGCGSSISQEEYQAEVRKARNRVDFALSQIAQAQTFEQVKARLRNAADETRAAAQTLDSAGAPDGLDGEADALVTSLDAFADELEGTALGLEDFGANAGATLSGFNFDNWTKVQDALRALDRQGVDVPPLDMHSGG